MKYEKKGVQKKPHLFQIAPSKLIFKNINKTDLHKSEKIEVGKI